MEKKLVSTMVNTVQATIVFAGKNYLGHLIICYSLDKAEFCV